MPQISRRIVPKDLEDKMNQLLWDSLVNLREQSSVAQFLDDILTRTERVMITKRLAIALLLLRGWDQEGIGSYLKVSTTTVQTIKRRLDSGGEGFKMVINLLEADKKWQNMKLDLAQAFEEILASRVGGNWKETKGAVYRKYKEKRAKENVI